ncbi:RNA polymerase sigma factor [Glaciecola sp. KUL10]|uniref:RNA polymerase sigma factor n=1 Tax=Glaciecola sp. (strain KUL10) TaxID=2161813 RepID=UPI000D78B0AD|nr:sigma-70 family RNA polymerase sigma factor [Glaciecola sp. KUL10]GBL02778.1 RNA polymerase sigma factor [Glaciecola sp. KUL10]
MTVFKQRKSIEATDDTSLVMTSLGGDRDAFCMVVSKYQNLLCSLAYASIGDIKQSEDLAQEVFVEAWQKLDTLRDPEKLRPWLCGILRFKISHYLRKQKKQPLTAAQDIDAQITEDFSNIDLENNAIKDQQESLLWNTLSNIDITYREPLVLFYREQQSVEYVANELDLTIGTAKQRLSRGRAMLKKAMMGLVEETLEKTKPGAAFTTAVAFALEDVTKSAAAAALGATSIKTSSLFKMGFIATFLASISGFISLFFGLRASLYQSRTNNERKLTIKLVSSFLLIAVIFVAGMYALKHIAMTDHENRILYTLIAQALILLFVICYFLMTSVGFKRVRTLRAHERIFHPEAFKREIDQISSKKRVYKSRLVLFGLPLFHFQLGAPEQGDEPTIGWVAGGVKAYGALFAWGGVAVAPISVGIISFGVISIGAVGVGVLSLSTVAIGVIGFGLTAVAYKAYSSISSLGWESAFSNGFSIAHDAAIGPISYAKEVNNELAYQLANFDVFSQHYQMALMLIVVLVVLPSYWHFNHVRQLMK